MVNLNRPIIMVIILDILVHCTVFSVQMCFGKCFCSVMKREYHYLRRLIAVAVVLLVIIVVVVHCYCPWYQ